VLTSAEQIDAQIESVLPARAPGEGSRTARPPRARADGARPQAGGALAVGFFDAEPSGALYTAFLEAAADEVRPKAARRLLRDGVPLMWALL